MMRAWFRNLFARNRVEHELDEELQSYIGLLAHEKEQSGLEPEAARRAALIQLGGLDQVKEEIRGIRAGNLIELWGRELRHALRALRKSPGFSASAVVALALGIGATTGVFSVVDAVILRPLPLADPDRLVCVWEDNREGGWPQQTPAPANYIDWRARNRVFTDMAALQGQIFAITGDGPPEQVEGNPVTANLFPLLGVSPVLGRHIAPDEDRSGAPRVALISHGLWQRRFGGEPSVIGRDIQLDRVPHRIIGVMPRGLAFPDRSDVWIPIAFTSQQLAVRDSHYLRVFARLKPGVSLEDARRDMNRVAAELAAEHPATNTSLAAVTTVMEQMVGKTRTGLWVALGGVTCLLLLTCINVSGLLLARGVSRSREFAVRLALGATVRQLARQALIECVILGVAACIAGWAFASLSMKLLMRVVPPELSTWAQPSLDMRVALFGLTLGVAAALLAGVVPCVAAARLDPAAMLQQGGRAGISGRSRTRRALVVGQLALSVVLCVGAGLMIQTFRSLSSIDLGFRPENVLTSRTSLPLSAESPYRRFSGRTAFYEHVLTRVKAIPGVISAGYTTFLPLTNGGGTSYFLMEGQAAPRRPDENDANIRLITADYLQTIGVRLRAGRFFSASDGAFSMPVAIINEAMAQRYWGGRDPIGTRIRKNQPGAPWITVVGVVATVRQNGIELAGRPEMYFPATQPSAGGGWAAPRDLAVRVQGDPLQYGDAVRHAVWAVDPHQPVSAVMPLQQLVDGELVFRDTLMRLLTAFAVLALLISSFGLYGLLAYTVGQRTREIGLRVAMGALPRQVLAMTLRDGLTLVAFGSVIGLISGVLVAGLARGMLYGVQPHDPASYLAAVLAPAVCGLLAALGPSLRAAMVDPMTALRLE